LIQRPYGVGPLGVPAILAELGDCRCLARSDDAVRQSGPDLTACQSESTRAPGDISHAGPELLRRALLEAARHGAGRASPDHGSRPPGR